MMIVFSFARRDSISTPIDDPNFNEPVIDLNSHDMIDFEQRIIRRRRKIDGE
jgi:hypothetical protein